MLDIFTDNWDNTPVLNDGERLVRILTNNPMNELYTIVDDSMDDDEIHEEIQFALRRKSGKAVQYGGFEDASYICEEAKEIESIADEGWDGEGYYSIGWSDGGMDWTNNGPVWFDLKDDLESEISVAYDYKTETHIPYANKVKQFEQNELDALLDDSKDDFDVESIIEQTTALCFDGNRYWTVDNDKLAEIIKSCEW